MTTWIIDVDAREGQRVLPGYEVQNRLDQRFRKVTADHFSEAYDKAVFESRTLRKLAGLLAGQEHLMSDKELNWLIDQDLYPLNVVSVHNVHRCGILDAYVVGKTTCPTIRAARVKAGLDPEPVGLNLKKEEDTCKL